jgi:hypothetical protein
VARGKNAQIAVDYFNEIVRTDQLGPDTAWKAIAKLLLTCEVWEGKRIGWRPLYDRCIVFRESNDFHLSEDGADNETVRLGKQLGEYLATQLGIPTEHICSTVGAYWRLPEIGKMQPHNLVGHAFRSMCVAYLERFGDPGISYEEEVSPHAEFPGFPLQGASPRAKIDVVARRGTQTVALMSSKWRYRHDRVEFIEEFMRYLIAAKRSNPNCELYALTGEFSPARLHKGLESCFPTSKHGPMSAIVHFAPELVWNGLAVNGRTAELRGLPYLAKASHEWH